MGVTRRAAITRIAGGGLALAAIGTGATATIGAPHPPGTPRFDARTLTPQQMRDELDFLVRVLLEVSVDPFQNTPRAQFESRLAAVHESAQTPMSPAAFYLRIAPVFAALNDGHLSLNIVDLYTAFRERGGRAFPFNVRFDDDGNVYAADDMAPEVPRNSRIVSINGQTAQAFTRAVFTLISAQNLTLKRRWAPGAARPYLFARYGDRGSYTVQFIRPASSRLDTRVVQATNMTQFIARLPKDLAAVQPAYAFRRIAGGSVGFIDYRRCEDLDRFKTFCQQTFAEIKKSPVRGVIVDIRQNGGGDSSLNEVLCSYLSAKPLLRGGEFSVRANNRLRYQYGWLKYAQTYLPPALFAPDGKVITYDFSSYRTQPGKSNPLRFDGPVYLLVSAQTFSSAMDCAQLMKDSGVAILVGQPPAEPVNSNGEVYSFYAPRSGILANFPTKYFFSKGYRNGQCVQPDVRIVPSEADVRAGRDPVLDYAVHAILSGAK